MFRIIHPNRWLFWFVALALSIISIVWWQAQLFLIDLEQHSDIPRTQGEQLSHGGDRDAHDVVATTTIYSDLGTKLIELGGDYFTDGEHIYEQVGINHQYNIEIVELFDAPTFKVLGPCWVSGNATRDFYTLDKNHVYCGDKIITGANPGTFVLLNDELGDIRTNGVASLAKDKDSVFAGGPQLNGIEAATFKYLGRHYVQDAKAIYFIDPEYFKTKIIDNVDIPTFEIASIPDDVDGFYDFHAYRYFARDKNHTYKEGEVYTGKVPDEIFTWPTDVSY